MAQESNTHDRYDLATNGENVRESLADIVYNIQPEKTPLMSNIGRETAEAVKKDWLIDEIGAADYTNKHIDGNQFAGDALVSPARLGNYLQISKEQLVVTRRANKVNKAGRAKEMAYQLAKKSSKLKISMEAILHANIVAAAGDATTAPTTAGLCAWIGVAVDTENYTVSNRGSLGSDGALTGTNDGTVGTAATHGTKRALSEATMLSIVKNVKLNGGTPMAMHVHPDLKQQMSLYMFGSSARIATPFQDHGKTATKGITAIGSVDTYISDFGALDIVPNQYQDVDTKALEGADESTLFVLDYDMLAVAYLDSFKVEDMGKNGDTERKHVLSDYCLVVKNPAGLGIIADIDDDAAMTT